MNDYREPWYRNKDHYRGILLSDGRPVAAIIGGGHENPFSEEEMDKFARRIIACVNACEGINTDDLKRYYNSGEGLDSAMDEASLKDHVSAVKQRNKLLEMLQTMCNGLEWNIENHPEVMNEADGEALEQARALIAEIESAV